MNAGTTEGLSRTPKKDKTQCLAPLCAMWVQSSTLDPKEFQDLATITVRDTFREGKPDSPSVECDLFFSLPSHLHALLLNTYY